MVLSRYIVIGKAPATNVAYGIMAILLLMVFCGCSQKAADSPEKVATKKSKPEKKVPKQITSADRTRARQYINLAEKLKARGKKQKAIAQLVLASELDPGNLAVEMELADYFKGRQDFNKCYKHANRAIEIDPENIEARLYRAISAFYKSSLSNRDKMEKQAIGDIKKVLELDPDNAKAHLCVGVWSTEQGKHEQAVEHFSKTIASEPDSEVYSYRAMAYISLKQYDKALDDLAYVLKSSPDGWTARHARAGVYAESGQLDKAYDDYSYLVKAEPNRLRARFSRADIAVKMKKYDRAIEDYNVIVKANGMDDDAFNRRGNVYFLMGKYDKALEDFSTAIDIEPGIIDYYLSRAKCHDKLGNKSKAEADRKKAEKLRKEPAIKKL